MTLVDVTLGDEELEDKEIGNVTIGEKLRRVELGRWTTGHGLVIKAEGVL